MSKQARAKQERVIEAVRRGLEGDAAVEFIHQSGYAVSQSGIARHLRALGGRGVIESMIEAGRSNLQILEAAFPGETLPIDEAPPPSQGELFQEDHFPNQPIPFSAHGSQPFETTKVTIKLPTDVHEAIKLAAHAEGKSRNELIVDILTTALSQVPDANEDGNGEASAR